MRSSVLSVALLACAARVVLAQPGAGPGVAAGAPATLENAHLRVELIGLRRWTVPMIQDSLRRYAPNDSLLSHACAAVLRDKLHFADASVAVYPAEGQGKTYIAVTVVEPQDSARVRYRAVPRDSAPDAPGYAPVRRVVAADTPTYQRLLRRADLLRSDRPLAPADSELRPALPVRAFARAHRRPADRDRALRVLAADGNARNRAAALVVLGNFAGEDRAWWALADALRDPAPIVSVTAQQLLAGLVQSAPRPVDWRPAAESLRALLDGTNLFAHNAVMEVLAATAVAPDLAPALLCGGGDIAVAKLGSGGLAERRAARRFLTRLAGRDLGADPAAWRAWAAAL